MNKSLILVILLSTPFFSFGQGKKSEWIIFTPSYTYNGGSHSGKGNDMSFTTEFGILDEKKFVFSVSDGPLTFYDDGKTFPTNRTIFDPFIKSTTSAITGGITNNVTAVYVDKNGTIWLGSSKGLLNLPKTVYASLPDGLDNINGPKGTFFNDEVPGMPFKTIQSITGDNQGNIWVAGAKKSGTSFIPEGISRFDGKEWKQFIPTEQSGKPIGKLTTDSQGTVLGTVGNIVFKFNGSQWTFLGSPEGEIKALKTDSNNNVYVGTSSGLFRLENNKWIKLEIPELSSSVTAIGFDANTTWVGSSSSGIFQVFPNKTVIALNQENSPIPSNSIMHITVDQHNRKWFYTGNGWAGYKEPDFKSDKVDVLNRYTIGYTHEFVEDALYINNKWMLVTSDAGLVAFNGKEFQKISTKMESAHTSAAVDKNGKLYMGTTKYLYILDGDKLEKWDIKEDAVTKRINDVLVDDKNHFWFAHNKGVSKFDGASWQHFDKKSGLTSNAAVILFMDSKNNIWVVTSDGISKYNGTAWENFTKKTSGFAVSGMKGVSEHNGKVFFSNGWSLIEYDGTTLKEVSSFKKIDGGINHFVMDAEGNYWFASADKGIVKFSNGIFSYYTTDDGLPSNNINRIYMNGSEVWASSGQQATYTPTPMGPGAPAASTAPAPSQKEILETKIKDFEPKFALVRIKQ